MFLRVLGWLTLLGGGGLAAWLLVQDGASALVPAVSAVTITIVLLGVLSWLGSRLYGGRPRRSANHSRI